jgi:hypothetical protein
MRPAGTTRALATLAALAVMMSLVQGFATAQQDDSGPYKDGDAADVEQLPPAGGVSASRQDSNLFLSCPPPNDAWADHPVLRGGEILGKMRIEASKSCTGYEFDLRACRNAVGPDPCFGRRHVRLPSRGTRDCDNCSYERWTYYSNDRDRCEPDRNDWRYYTRIDDNAPGSVEETRAESSDVIAPIFCYRD